MKKTGFNAEEFPRNALGPHAVRAGDFVFLSGQVPFDEATGLVPQVTSGFGHGTPAIDAGRQTQYVLRRAAKSLEAAGSSLALGVRIDQFVTDPLAASAYLEARGEFLETPTRPASTHIQIDNFLVPGALVGVQLIAIAADGKAKKGVLVVPDMTASPGPPFKPAPHAVTGGPFIFVTGQTAHDFDGGGLEREAATNPETWYGSPIKLQTAFAIKRCARILKEAGCGLADVVRADVYLTNMTDMFEFDQVWRKHFPVDPPALAFMPTRRLAPKSTLIEINMIALLPGQTIRKQAVSAPAPKPQFHCPHAMRAGDFVFISSLCASNGDGEISGEARVSPAAPWFGSSAKRQTSHILRQMETICRAAGAALKNVAWTQNMFVQPEDFEPSREVWNQAFGSDLPASLVIGVQGPLLATGCTIMVDAIAFNG
jgi:enamine deaminase RidA (YjgF/YER057c/UK114 family)